jgi:hypothetical protein
MVVMVMMAKKKKEASDDDGKSKSTVGMEDGGWTVIRATLFERALVGPRSRFGPTGLDD